MTGYNAKSQKVHAAKDRKQEKKSRNGNVFQNLITFFVNIFGKKSYRFFFYAADPEILSFMGQLFNKAGGTRLKLVLQPNFWL